MSLTPTSITDSSSPFELRTLHRHPQHKLDSRLAIGTTCYVSQGDAARRSQASKVSQTYQGTPHSELGVCMGPSQSTPGSYDFILGSGRIRPRRNITIVNVANPFGWPSRKVNVTYIRNPVLPPRDILKEYPGAVTPPTAPSVTAIPATTTAPVPSVEINPLVLEPTITQFISSTGTDA